MSYDYTERPGPNPDLWKTIVLIAAAALGVAITIGVIWALEFL